MALTANTEAYYSPIWHRDSRFRLILHKYGKYDYKSRICNYTDI